MFIKNPNNILTQFPHLKSCVIHAHTIKAENIHISTIRASHLEFLINKKYKTIFILTGISLAKKILIIYGKNIKFLNNYFKKSHLEFIANQPCKTIYINNI